MSEAQILISAVKKHPCLWNIYEKDYRKRDIKDLAWEQVFKDVIKDWDTCSKTEKENKGAEIKKKWTHIRDYYRRGLQKQSAPTSTVPYKVKKYVYADLLHFLTPIFDEENTEENYETEDFEISYSEEWEPKKEDQLYVEEEGVHQQEGDHTNLMQPSSPVSSGSLKRKQEDNLTLILSILQQNQKKVNQNCEKLEDDDTKFLLSFRTYMKNMNENQKIEFKMEMLQLVKKINNGYL